MKAFRSLIYVVVTLLVIAFVLENEWMTARHAISYNVLTLEIGQSPPIPVWGLVLTAFLLGYLLAWFIGRLDIVTLRGQVRKLKKQLQAAEARIAEMEVAKAPVKAEPLPVAPPGALDDKPAVPPSNVAD